MDPLRITSWNCRGVRSNIEIIAELCKESQILALQETLLWPHDILLTDNIHNDFISYSKSAVPVEEKIIRHRPYGGLSFLWKKSLDSCITIVNFENPRLLGMKLNLNNNVILILNVYMPWETQQHFDHYSLLLGEIQSIIEDSDANHYCIIGDLNAHPTRQFFNELTQFCNNNSLIISDISLLPENSYTYLKRRDDNINTSWLDHCLSSFHFHNSIISCKIIDTLGILDDHLPLQIEISTTDLPIYHEPPPLPRRINWSFNNSEKCLAYTTLSEINLRNIYQPVEALLCNNQFCNNDQHRRDISNFYCNINNSLFSTGSTIFGYLRQHGRVVPGWNDHVKDLHSHARGIFLLWRENGSPRNGPLAFMMRRSRAHFKLALRYCRRHEAQLRADALSNKLEEHDFVNFWKNINSLTPRSTSTTQKVGDAVGREAICEHWVSHFDPIYNCVIDRESKERVNNLLSGRAPAELRVSSAEVKEAIKHLAGNKAQGCDGLPAEAFKFADPILHELLAAVFNACLIHQFLPESLMLVHIIPLIKNKLKDASDPGNYRPIAITTIASKILESILLIILAPFLNTADNQFGFKENHSTDTCIYILKEILNYYNSSGSPLFLCFVDVRKAFDRVNYNKLFIKLSERGAPLMVIGLLSFWFSSQQFCVSWGGILSRSFGSANGLRQGGILSPHLFNVYTDELTQHLNTLNVGCSINGQLINNLSYADDMVLISPSAKGLQQLINACCNYAERHDIIYNETKTQCMMVIPRALQNVPHPQINLGGHPLQFVNEFPYLGHIITSDLKDNKDIDQRRRKLCALGNLVTRRYSFCNLDTKLLLFRSYFYSIYGSPLWASYTQEQLRRIKVVHNDILRRLTGTPRFHSASALFTRLNVRTMKEVVRSSIVSLMFRLRASANSLIINLLRSEARARSVLWPLWLREAQVN